MSKWEYLQYTPEDKNAMLKNYNRTENDLNQDVKIIQDWIATQPHLPKLLEDKKIEKFIMLNKFSIEKTKQKIDMYFSIRRFFPEIYEKKGPLSKPLPKCGKDFQWVILPKLDQNGNRILLFNFPNQNSDDFDFLRVLGYALCVAEIRLEYDFCVSDVVCFDLKNLTLGYLSKATPTVLKQIITISEEVFSMRIKAFYMIHTSPLVEKLVTLLKTILKPKMAERVKTFSTLEDFYQVVPKELLPKNYGGNQLSVPELIDVWNAKIQENSDWFDSLRNNPVDENLRPGKPLNDDFLGYHGNFKKLNVD